MKFFKSIAIIIMLVAECGHAKDVVFPAPLKEGDKIAILAPAGPVSRGNVDGAAAVIRELGYEPVIFPTVNYKTGQFAGSPEQRFADVKKAFMDPEIRAVLCARGGYGLVHIIDSIAALPLEEDPKWVIGFSDITALHGVMASKGIASIHGSMTLHIARGMDEPENVCLFDILKGELPEYTFGPDSHNHLGKAEGKLLGGNLSVLEGLAATPFQLANPGTILFIEDVGEEIYKLERMLYRLKLSGVLGNLKGMIIGQFTNIPGGMNYSSVTPMINNILKDYPDLPVAYNIPIGHIRNNVPVIESSKATLVVDRDSVTLTMDEWRN